MPRPPFVSERVGLVIIAISFAALWGAFDVMGAFTRLWAECAHVGFYRDILVGFAVLLGGIPLGLWLAEVPLRAEEKQRHEALQNRKTTLFDQIAEELDGNIEHAQLIQEMLGVRNMLPTFKMGVAALESTVPLWHEYELTPNQRRQLGHMLFELRHLNDRLSLMTIVTCLGANDDETDDERSNRRSAWDRLVTQWRTEQSLNDFVLNRLPDGMPALRIMRSLDVAAGTISLAASVQEQAKKLRKDLPTWSQ